MPEYTQPALFPDTEIVGTGRPKPWPVDELDATSAAAPATDEKPAGELSQPETLFDDAALDAA